MHLACALAEVLHAANLAQDLLLVRALAEVLLAAHLAQFLLFVASFAEVIDDLERSLAAGESAENQGAFAEGVRLIHANLVKALNDHGLEKIEALHERFDPNIHEALMRQPSDEHEPGTVVEVSEVSGGKGGFWEDLGYDWYGGI